ncbi:MAG: hypothetical protein EOO65_05675 [Methanosarcinales archaeon]|nr:MAG: hypothetical protein EOO65_05675 [Methanosarcinales archaeon]
MQEASKMTDSPISPRAAFAVLSPKPQLARDDALPSADAVSIKPVSATVAFVRPPSDEPHARAGARVQSSFVCLPAFVIVGAQKASTTALFAQLMSSPHVVPPLVKETHYFFKGAHESLLQYLRFFQDYAKLAAQEQVERSVVGGGLEAPGTDVCGWSSHSLHVRWPHVPAPLLHFLACHITGEATPSYSLSSSALRRMVEIIPAARLIFLTRHPVARALSEYVVQWPV